MIFSKELENAFEEYQKEIGLAIYKPTYLAGAAALENLIMKSGECEFNDDAAWEASSIDNWVSFEEGARWQHKNDQLIIGALKQQLSELNKNCISIDLHESRMKKVESNYDTAIKVQNILREKLEAV